MSASDELEWRRRAAQMLVLATLFWGLSFPAMKALGILQQELLPGASSWFVSASALTVRFSIAALIMLVWSIRTLHRLTALEVWQGAGLGVFAGGGLLFQMDGLAYTPASTSAFLTQCYCVLLPIIVMIRDRKRPNRMVIVCALAVVTGVAILARVDWRSLSLGRGEWETLIGSLLFTGQILWLERPMFSANRVDHCSMIMFGVIAAICLPIAVMTATTAKDWLVIYSSWAAAIYQLILIFGCTMVAFVLMNRWQRYLPSTEAGLIYCAEPVFASLFALFLPAWFARMGGIQYPNEGITWNLLVGGGFITTANILLHRWSGRE